MQIKITGKEIAESAETLRVLADVDAATKKSLFKFKPKIKIILAKRLKQLAELTKDLEEHRRQLMEEHGLRGVAEGPAKDAPEAVAAFNKSWVEYLDAEQDVDMGQIEEAELDLENNDIPHTYLAALDWMIKWAAPSA